MQTKLVIPFLAVAAFVACAKKDTAPGIDTSMAAMHDSMAAPTAAADPDRQAGGSGLPAGYLGRTDNPNASISGAKYSASGTGWEIVTGPAHIVYRSQDMATGNYTVSATLEQLEKPAHPESYGIFFGGKDLDKSSQTYSYFLVRGTGDLAVKVRDGATTRDVLKWTPSADVPKQDAAGKANYSLAVQVTSDAVKFTINGKQVASVAKAGLPTNGIAGLRINHNLHVRITPVSIKTP